jgi:hypothetical protein
MTSLNCSIVPSFHIFILGRDFGRFLCLSLLYFFHIAPKRPESESPLNLLNKGIWVYGGGETWQRTGNEEKMEWPKTAKKSSCYDVMPQVLNRVQDHVNVGSFNAILIRLVIRIKITLLLKLQWKKHRILLLNIVYIVMTL